MKKTNTLGRYACAAVALLFLATACSKSDNSEPIPVDPVKPGPFLLETVTTTTSSGTKTDSFVYNNKHQLIAIYIPSRMRPENGQSFEMTYDEAGRVAKTINNSKSGIISVGNPNWKGGKVSIFEQHPECSNCVDQSWSYEFNNLGQVGLIGSKDSLFSTDVVRYFEYTYEGKDVVKEYQYPGGPKVHDPARGYTYTYKYDKGNNPFYTIYKNNPYVHFYSELTSVDVMPSEHNLSYADHAGTTYTYENSYDEKTGLLMTQKVTITNSSSVSYKSARFKYIEVK
ncbi:hypothetical protein HGH92_17475 [Chitinophaga varians]|uniref:DUF4595 domain-containing protein n=1 Tax=Chitinophaga varians TaxID=2202339 RepID=A0A847RT06_9BACT|nr:hypothetical protein [Chitinophaga varians]NLR66102.1 hypothetical protein [Chitinophaga varians]